MKRIFYIFLLFIFSTYSVIASDLKFVQIDDVRFSPFAEDSVENLKNTVKEINKQKNVSFVVFTGNNIARSDSKYLEAFLKNANKLHCPYYVALGHKDLNKKKGLSKTAYIEIVNKKTHKNIKSPNYTFKKNGMLFIVADGAKEFIPTPFGYYREDVINFIDKELSNNSKKNVIILQHFPIYPPNSSESFRTYKADDYKKMLSNHNNVKAIISGFNVDSENDVDGVKHITTANFPKYRIIEISDCNGPKPTIWSTLK